MRHLFSILSILVCLAATAQDKIRVACVGNSVTYGYNIPDREHYSYPAQLQTLMGDQYDVRNFGRSSATMTHRSPMWYMRQPEFRQALDFRADIVVIHLGLNDTDPRWWPNYSEEFIPDYRALIDSFRVANPEAKIYVCLMTPIGHAHRRFQSGTRDWHAQVQQAIRKVALGSGAQLIDLFTPLYSRPDLFPDALHPDADGAAILARTVYKNITGQFGGLTMPYDFSDNMVLQRDQPLTINGTADAGERVTVRLSKEGQIISMVTTTGLDGHWVLTLPEQPMGGPYQLEISAPSRTLTYNDVWMGDVWLCSGQSNMEFKISQCDTRQTDLAEAPLQDRLHVLNMFPIAPTTDIEWDADVLAKVGDLQYLTTAGWQTMRQADVPNTSAVAYHFARTLLDSLPDLHIGIICNAVGGSPLEAWIDRWTLQYEYPQILYDWRKNDHIQQWVRERGSLNTAKATNPLQRHPYEPCYLYECGIQSLGVPALKGVIWYQGESNAHNTELHERLFPLFERSWRRWFGQADLPFYFVQLSSLSRPSWPRFRDSQRQLAEWLPDTWMAVCSDIGDSLDVHPVSKQPVGYRLALQALCHSYQHTGLVAQGPTPESATLKGNDVVVSFTSARTLQTPDGAPVQTFEVAGPDGLYHPAEAAIEGNTIRLSGFPSDLKPVSVRYGWQPFTRANLQNEAHLPTSTFQLAVDE